MTNEVIQVVMTWPEAVQNIGIAFAGALAFVGALWTMSR